MPRSSSVSEKVWAQAIHAVTVQKMSLRRAAQLYGVHHMSLHRRVRGRYVGPATARFADEFQLAPTELDEAVSVLREQLVHERHVTSDDVRYVVRTIACQGGHRDVPADFPRSRWIANFKRAHGFGSISTSNTSTSSDSTLSHSRTNSSGSGTSHHQHQHQQFVRADSQVSNSSGSGSDSSNYTGIASSSTSSFAHAPNVERFRYAYSNNSAHQDNGDDDEDVDEDEGMSPRESSRMRHSDSGMVDLSHAAARASLHSFSSSSGSGNSARASSNVMSPMYNASASRMASAPSSMFAPPPTAPARAFVQQQQQHRQQVAPSPVLSTRLSIGDDARNETSESDSEHNQRQLNARRTSSARTSASAPSAPSIGTGAPAAPTATSAEDDDDDEKRSRQTAAVSAETWEKAMDAVEIHGMSLRNAAKAYGVHFAALHRRVKKRALAKETAPPLENYIPFEDEAGIVRVIHARADLGLLMSYDELVDLLQRTALKYAPALSSDFVRALVRRFQSRVEQSIRHLVRDWPLPRLDTLCHFRSPTNSSTDSDSGALTGDAVMTIANAADDTVASPFQPLSQRTVASLYARDHDFPSEPRPRLSVSAPFMRPLYARDADAALGERSSMSGSSGLLTPPSGALPPQQLTSPRGSILRL